MADNDVKIYQTKAQRLGTQVNLSSDFEVIHQNRANGNLEKAKDLGERLATLTPSFDSDGLRVNLKDVLSPKYLSQDILYQIKVLLVFEAEALLQLHLSVPALATTAVNALHDALRNNAPAFHKNISDGAAFTFYYLAVKKGGDIPQNIGESFAMLCSVKNNSGFIEAGKTVWQKAADVIEHEIRQVSFQ